MVGDREITRFIQNFGTSVGTALVQTDLGDGYLKALGNPEGPQALACELVGSRLAEWLGLSTFDFSLINLTEDVEIPFVGGGHADSGPAFISRAEPNGLPWGGTDQELEMLISTNDINGLVVLDTWVLNCDRYAPQGRRMNRDNVFLVQSARRARQLELRAMDFTHAFTCGREISRRLGFIDTIREGGVYGLFPEFEAFLDRDHIRDFSARLGQFSADLANEFVWAVPKEWEVTEQGRTAWARLIYERAKFVSGTIETKLWPQMALPIGGTE